MVDTTKARQALASVTPQQTLQELIEKSAKEFKKALPVHMRPERLVRIALTCIRTTPGLTQCTPNSFVGALLVSAQLGLEPMAGRAYILPFFNNKTGKTEAQFLVGYKGLAELFYRHEKSVMLAWGVVKKNDEFEYEYGTQAKLRHKPAMTERGDTMGFYVIAELQGAAKPFMYMSREDCMEHGKKHSKTYDAKTGQFNKYSPWFTDPDSMCLKTVLIQLSKLLPLSIELQKAISADETSREYREGIDDALDIPAQTWEPDLPSTATIPENSNPTQPELTISPKKDIDTPSPAKTGNITPAQVKALSALAKSLYGGNDLKKILEIIGSDYGLTAIEELSIDQASKLITKLNKENSNAK